VKLDQSLMSLSRANFPTVWPEQWSSHGSLALELGNTIANPVTIGCELSIVAYTGNDTWSDLSPARWLNPGCLQN
jgi:hypothetical protein